MKIISKTKKKANTNYFKIFLLIYFVFSIILLATVSLFFLSSYKFQKFITTNEHYIFKAGRFEYVYLPKIIFESTKSIFENVDKYFFVDSTLSINFILLCGKMFASFDKTK